MESLYEVGDSIYVLSKVAEVDEEDTDVRYVVTTALGKLFVTEKKDTLRRDPYSLPVQEDFTNKGKQSMYAYLVEVSNWSSTKLMECFGHSTISEVLNNYSYEDFISTYEDYSQIVELTVGSIVKYQNTKTCVIMEIESVNEDSTEPYTVYTLYDPFNRDFITTTTSTDITPLRKEISLDSVFDDIENAVDETY